MDQNYTDIVFVLDRTGSMGVIADDAVGGFNEFVLKQKEVPGKCLMTLIQFDTQDPYEVVHDAVPISEVSPLTRETYQPRAGTPLYDALGRAIVNAGSRFSNLPEHERPGKVVFVILTDGEENSSREYTRDKVFEMIKRQVDEWNWDFVYLGANQDAMAVGGAMGIPTAGAANFAPTSKGIRLAASKTGEKVAQYRSTGDKGALHYTDKDRKDMVS